MTLTLTDITKILTQRNADRYSNCMSISGLLAGATLPGKMCSTRRNWSKSGGCHITLKSLNT